MLANAWYNKIDGNVVQCCPIFLNNTNKLVLYHFLECLLAQELGKEEYKFYYILYYDSMSIIFQGVILIVS